MLPTAINATVYLDSQPAPGMFVRVRLSCRQKNSYDLIFGPTLGDGTVSINQSSLMAAAQRERSLFPMDYLELETEFTGDMLIEPLNALELQRALRAVRLFGSETYPENYVADLTNALSILAKRPAAVSIAVNVEGSGLTVRTKRS